MLANISSRYQYGPFFVAEVNMSNYLTTDGLKTIFSTSGGSPEARGICHMVNPALILSKLLITYRAVESVVSVCFHSYLLNRHLTLIFFASDHSLPGNKNQGHG